MKTFQLLSCALLLSACGGPEGLEQDSSSLSRDAEVRYGEWRRVYSSDGRRLKLDNGGSVSGTAWYLSNIATVVGHVRVVSAHTPLVPNDFVRYGDVVAIGMPAPVALMAHLGSPRADGVFGTDGLEARSHGTPNTVWRIMHPTSTRSGRFDPGSSSGQPVRCGSPFVLVSINQMNLAAASSAPGGVSVRAPRVDTAGRTSREQTWTFECALSAWDYSEYE